MAKTKARKVSSTKKVTKTPPVGFAVNYRGLGSTIHQLSVAGKKPPKGVFMTLVKAKKFLVTQLRTDVKKDLSRISKIKNAAGAPTKLAAPKKASKKAKRKKVAKSATTPNDQAGE